MVLEIKVFSVYDVIYTAASFITAENAKSNWMFALLVHLLMQRELSPASQPVGHLLILHCVAIKKINISQVTYQLTLLRHFNQNGMSQEN